MGRQSGILTFGEKRWHHTFKSCNVNFQMDAIIRNWLVTDFRPHFFGYFNVDVVRLFRFLKAFFVIAQKIFEKNRFSLSGYSQF
jgi:hypothetical protein